jgi:hypothetical protein
MPAGRRWPDEAESGVLVANHDSGGRGRPASGNRDRVHSPADGAYGVLTSDHVRGSRAVAGVLDFRRLDPPGSNLTGPYPVKVMKVDFCLH